MLPRGRLREKILLQEDDERSKIDVKKIEVAVKVESSIIYECMTMVW